MSALIWFANYVLPWVTIAIGLVAIAIGTDNMRINRKTRRLLN